MQTAARNVGALAANSLFSKGALFVWQLVLARWLGEAAYGAFGTVGALVVIATVISHFSMGYIIIRDVARDPDRATDYFSAALTLQAGLGLIAVVGMVCAAWLFGYGPQVRLYTTMAGVALLLDIVGNVCFDQLLAQERMVTTSIVDASQIFLRIGLVAGALALGYGLVGLYAVYIVTSVYRSVLLFRVLGLRPQWPANRAIILTLLNNSAPLAGASFLLLAYQQADKLMTTSYLGLAGTGYLTAAFVLISSLIELLNGTVLVAMYPLLSRAHGDGDYALFGTLVQKLAFFTLVVMLPVAAALTLFAPFVVGIFGPSYAPSAGVVAILVWYALVAMITNVFARALMVQNRQRLLLWVRAGALATNIALNLMFFTVLPAWGVLGVATATVLTEVAVLALMLLTAQDIDAHNLYPDFGRALLAAGPAAGVMALVGRVHPLAGMVAGGLVYLGLFRWVLAPDDWDLLYRLARAVPVVQRVWKRQIDTVKTG